MSSKMTVKKEAIMARFGGMGFHNSEANVWREMDDVQFNQYVGKVYRELSPGFSRMWGGFPEWTKEEMDAFAEYCEKMQCKVGATIYLTGHCVRYETDEELTAYASNVADRLEYLIYEKGLSMCSSASCRMTRSTSPVSSGSSAEVGSSKNKTFGCRASALAIDTLCCCPPES